MVHFSNNLSKNIYPIQVKAKPYDGYVSVEAFCIDKCNYKCSYCINLYDNKDRTYLELDLDKLKKFITYLHNNSGKKIRIILSGGEPTLHHKYLDFCNYAFNNNFELITYTNFSQTYEYYADLMKKYNVHFQISFHMLDDKRENEFIQKLEAIKQIGLIDFIDNINIVLLPDRFDECIKVYNKLYSICGNKVLSTLLNYTFKTNVAENTIESDLYSDSQIAQYLELYNNAKYDKYIEVKYSDDSVVSYSFLDAKNLLDENFKHWYCSAGKIYFQVSIEGFIYPCKMFQKKLATLDDFYNLKLSNTICNVDKCRCECGLNKKKIFKHKL